MRIFLKGFCQSESYVTIQYVWYARRKVGSNVGCVVIIDLSIFCFIFSPDSEDVWDPRLKVESNIGCVVIIDLSIRCDSIF